MSFESNSRLTRIESHVFDGLSCAIVLPSPALFIASDLGVDPDQLLLPEGDFCHEFHDWLEANKSRDDNCAGDAIKVMRLNLCQS
jgi:hypothetical protein